MTSGVPISEQLKASVRRLRRQGLTIREIARATGVCTDVVLRTCAGIPSCRPPRHTDDDIRLIRQQIADGIPKTDIANAHGTTLQMIQHIGNRTCDASVEE